MIFFVVQSLCLLAWEAVGQAQPPPGPISPAPMTSRAVSPWALALPRAGLPPAAHSQPPPPSEDPTAKSWGQHRGLAFSLKKTHTSSPPEHLRAVLTPTGTTLAVLVASVLNLSSTTSSTLPVRHGVCRELCLSQLPIWLRQVSTWQAPQMASVMP
jgi:hypothetical protein